MTTEADFLSQLTLEDAILVTIDRHRGSVPRDAGTWMAVFDRSFFGTIGGGHLEWRALAQARAQLHGAVPQSTMRCALGPSLGQCCGGEVHLRFERITSTDVPRLQTMCTQLRCGLPTIALFGGGHVGKALVHVLSTLPMKVHWVDSRDEIFPADTPPHIYTEHSNPVQSAVATLTSGALVLVMSFSHAQDLDVVAACLMRQRERADLRYVGLIGSDTKWATFRHRLEERGFSAEEMAHVTCPIGVPGIQGKSPEVIAVAVAAQLLQVVSNIHNSLDETSRTT